MTQIRFPHLALIGLVVAGLALSGCGRRGKLEPPPSAETTEPQAGQPEAGQPEAEQPDQPFILDVLL